MTRNPIGTAAFLGPVAGHPGMVAMWCDVPMAINFFIATIVPMPFGTNPNVMGIWSGRPLHLMFVRSLPDIIMLCADA